MNFLSLLILSLLTLPVFASTIAIIDSGVDYKLDDYTMWMNPNEKPDRRDNDGNGYQDDIYGWNFANDNADIIDYSFLGTFTDKPYKYFEVQGRMFLNEHTEEDIKWLKQMRCDKEFGQEMQIFGNFVHGTHVAGIAAGANKENEVIGLKIMPTQAKPFFERAVSLGAMGGKGGNPDSPGLSSKLLKGALTQLANAQSRLMRDVGRYLADKNVDVANGSFGSNYFQLAPIIKMGYKILFFKSPKELTLDQADSEGDLHPFLMHFMQENLKGSSELVKYSPNTLFVFAAGNNGENNDIYPTSPANLQEPNVITVAATYNYDFIASFSNYGMLVDVAAPGMLIESSIPGNKYLKVSGTSQASPFVANVAAEMKNINKSLSPAQMKQILMGTVDKRDYLIGKVLSAGSVNASKAYLAASLSKTKSVEEAIAIANTRVSEIVGTGRKGPKTVSEKEKRRRRRTPPVSTCDEEKEEEAQALPMTKQYTI